MTRTWFGTFFILFVFTVPAVAADGPSAPSRGLMLPTLYVSFAALNAYDAASTIHALDQGAVEANPLLDRIAGRPAELWAMKGSVTAASILAADHLWRKGHKGQAIALMVTTNGVMAAVAAHNTSILRGLK